MEKKEFVVEILYLENVTHNVKRFRVEKPPGYKFIPGQATDVSVNKTEWKKKKRPFTFTALNEESYLEFTIKRYPDHHGVTDELHKLNVGDEIIVRDVWGAIAYKGEGVFIAGGAGVTPFIAIFRQLYKDDKIGNNKLIFSNKRSEDIILKDEFEQKLGNNFIKILTEEKVAGIYDKRIDKDYIKREIKNFKQHFYVCGPDKFVKSISADLIDLGAAVEEVVIEK